MSNVKGTSVTTVRQLLRHMGEDKEQALLKLLAEDDIKLYKNTLPISWVPVEFVGRLYEKMAEAIYPGNALGLVNVGKETLLADMKGIYKYLLRLTTVPFLINKAAVLFSTYHDQGSARCEEVSANASTFIVEDHALHKAYRQTLQGSILALLELAGVKNPKITADFSKPNLWKYRIEWA